MASARSTTATHVGDAARRRRLAGRDAALDLVDDRRRVLAARVVRGDDHDVAQPRRHHAHQRPLGAIAIAAAAEDGDEPPAGERPRRLEQVAQRVVGVGVVDDDGHVVVRRRHHLEASGHAAQLREPGGDGVEPAGRWRTPRRWPPAGCRRWAGRPAAIGRRPDRRGVAVSNAHTRQVHRQALGPHVGGLLNAVGQRPGAGRAQGRGPGVVGVDHPRRLGRQHLEEPALGREVRLHVLVEVEVIAGQVGEDGGGEAHAVDALEGQRVRRHLHHARAVAVRDHVAQESLHVGGFGRGPARPRGPPVRPCSARCRAPPPTGRRRRAPRRAGRSWSSCRWCR